MSCAHLQFNVVADVARVLHEGKELPAYYHVDIRLNCRDCGAAFEWHGLPYGFSPYQPSVSIDNQELRVSAMPKGETIQSGLPGFRVTHETFPQKDETRQLPTTAW